MSSPTATRRASYTGGGVVRPGTDKGIDDRTRGRNRSLSPGRAQVEEGGDAGGGSGSSSLASKFSKPRFAKTISKGVSKLVGRSSGTSGSSSSSSGGDKKHHPSSTTTEKIPELLPTDHKVATSNTKSPPPPPVVDQSPSNEEDEEIRFAKAMAMMMAKNPNMPPDKIRKLIMNSPEFQKSQQQQRFVEQAMEAQATDASNNSGPSLLAGASKGLSTIFQTGASTLTNLGVDGSSSDNHHQPLASQDLDDLGAGDYNTPKRSKSQFKDFIKESTRSAGKAAKKGLMEIVGTTSTTTNTTTAAAERPRASTADAAFTNLAPTSMPSPPTLQPMMVVPPIETAKSGSPKLKQHITPSGSTTTTKDINTGLTAVITSGNSPTNANSTTGIPHLPILGASDMTSHPPPTSLASPTLAPNTIPHVRLTDVVWKRRSGLGKYSSTSAWEPRRVVLRGSRLLYYRNTFEGAEEAAAEGEEMAERGVEEAGKLFNDDTPHRTSKSTGARVYEAFLGIPSSTSKDKGEGAPRGYLDLVKEGATVAASFADSGAPSPFCISIKVRGETKWKLCFSSHKTQMEWLAAITDVTVQTSVDEYNKQLLLASNPTVQDALLLSPTNVSEPPTSSVPHMAPPPTAPALTTTAVEVSVGAPVGAVMPQSQVSGHRLWMLEPYTIQGELVQDDSGEGAVEDDEDATGVGDDDEDSLGTDADDDLLDGPQASERGLADIPHSGMAEITPGVIVPESNLVYVALVVNMALLTTRASSLSVDGFWLILLFTNLALYSNTMRLEEPLAKPTPPKAVSPTGNRRSARRSVKKKKVKDDNKKDPTDPDKKDSAMEEFIPSAGLSSMRIKETTDLPTNAKGDVFAGWRAPPGDIFNVRSQGYLTTKKKVSSPGELYEILEFDVFESPSRYPDMAPRVKLPSLTYEADPSEIKTWKSPDIFVVSVALPTDPPKMGRTSSDGGGYTLTMYFGLRKETREVLKRVTADGYNPAEEEVEDVQKSTINAVRLFEEWCRRSPTDPKFQARFKVIPNAQNCKEIGLPSWIAKYNAKPFLIKRAGQTGFLFVHPELSCIEFDVSLHVFPYLAKQAICYLKESMFKKLLCSVGFVIEGRSDDELPECVIGAIQVCYPDPAIAIQAKEFFSGEAPRSR